MRFANNYNLNDVVQFPEYISTTKDIYSEQDSLRFVIMSSTGKDLGSYNKSEKKFCLIVMPSLLLKTDIYWMENHL